MTCLYIIQPLTKYAEDQISHTQSSVMLPLLRNPTVLIALTSATCAAFAIGYIESLLELHLEIFALEVSSIGLCFLAMSGSYTLCTILTGWLTDTRYGFY